MKKTMIAVLAVTLLLAALCGQALASCGDVTIKAAKVYADPAMTEYLGTLPAYTAVVVRDYDTYADIFLVGSVVYIKPSTLMRKDITAKFTATLNKGVTVYQRPTEDANTRKIKKATAVKLCKFSGEWALVQTTGKKGLYAFAKIEDLSNIQVNVLT